MTIVELRNLVDATTGAAARREQSDMTRVRGAGYRGGADLGRHGTGLSP